MAELSEYLIKSLSVLRKDDPELSEMLVQYTPLLVSSILRNCSYYKLEPDDAFQQLIIKLLSYSKDYKTSLFRYKGKICKVVFDIGDRYYLDHPSFEENVLAYKNDVDRVIKMTYTSFIKMKIGQELHNIREGYARKKDGCTITQDPLTDIERKKGKKKGKQKVVYPYPVELERPECLAVIDQANIDPETFLIAKETISEADTSLSKPAKRFLSAIEQDSSLCDNHLVRSVKLHRRRLQYARREVKNTVTGAYLGSKVHPIHLKASAIRW